MNKKRGKRVDKFFEALRERAKELDCLYKIEELMRDPAMPLEQVCTGTVEAIPTGWQFPDICVARLILGGEIYQSPEFAETPWVLHSAIKSQTDEVGKIGVYYTEEMPSADIGPFLKEEKKLIEAIADRLGHFIHHKQMRETVREWETARNTISTHARPEWRVALDFLRQTEKSLFLSLSHKMLNHLCWSGIEEAERLRRDAGGGHIVPDHELLRDTNLPHEKQAMTFSAELSEQVFALASTYLSDSEILDRMYRWIQEDQLSFLVQVANRNLPLSDVADAIRRYHHSAPQEQGIFSPSKRGIQVSLIRRFLSDQLSYLSVAKNYIEIADLYDLLQRVIYSPESHGKLGGKSAGVILASHILKVSLERGTLSGDLKTPKTWYITSDVLLQFMHYNNFDEVVEQKYKDIDQVRVEYPYIIRTFKNSPFPVEIVQGLSLALDDFGDKPLIVRSSSLLEDRAGSAFSGKYKSLFLANRGTKQERLDALTDAIAEVYASTFGPDPIEYRAERGLTDFGEEMAIMIQEVVGNKVGKYYLPTFAGVAFSRNEFRWSPRIKREDGLIRIVPGLGTRAVDRLSDDYPILISPGQPNLRVNASLDEVVRYSPREVDVINLETSSFETISLKKLLREVGNEIPGIDKVVSVLEDDHIRDLGPLGTDFSNNTAVAGFGGFISDARLVKHIHSILRILEKEVGTPVDIEFASDGTDFYLLQCRPQAHSPETAPAPIPRDIPKERVLFTARKHVSDGTVDGITHVVYVDAMKYQEASERSTLIEIGRAVGTLNRILPKRQFILIGPGRWGSRGDIKLGVSVTYSDISNAAMLIEVAREHGGYVPDLSFGTHFFQDLVETNVRYLPLYPDSAGAVFNDEFFDQATNILPELAKEHAHLSPVLRVIDVKRASGGSVLRVAMNSELDEALCYLFPAEADE